MTPEEGKVLLESYKISYTDIEGIPVVDMNDLTIEQKKSVVIMREKELKQQVYKGIHYYPTSAHDSEYITMEGRGVIEYFDQKLMIIKNDHDEEYFYNLFRQLPKK